MAPFRLHERLVADCEVLGRTEHCHLLLHRNGTLPWFILVPETEAIELLDLPDQQLQSVMRDCARLSRFVKSELGWPKTNFGAIGNLVPQLHLHVIGRRPDDACWPAPVWGHLEDVRPDPESELADLRTRLGRAGLLL